MGVNRSGEISIDLYIQVRKGPLLKDRMMQVGFYQTVVWYTGGRTDVMQQHREQRRQNTIGGYILNQSFAVMSFPFMSLSQRSEEEADPSIFRTLLQHKSIFSTTKAPPQTEPIFPACNSKHVRD